MYVSQYTYENQKQALPEWQTNKKKEEIQIPENHTKKNQRNSVLRKNQIRLFSG